MIGDTVRRLPDGRFGWLGHAQDGEGEHQVSISSTIFACMANSIPCC